MDDIFILGNSYSMMVFEPLSDAVLLSGTVSLDTTYPNLQGICLGICVMLICHTRVNYISR